jgi:hypothetical protein
MVVIVIVTKNINHADHYSPATFALEAQTKSQSTPNLNLCFALTHTYIHILIYALALTRTCAYTLNYSGSKCPGSMIRVTLCLV